MCEFFLGFLLFICVLFIFWSDFVSMLLFLFIILTYVIVSPFLPLSYRKCDVMNVGFFPDFDFSPKIFPSFFFSDLLYIFSRKVVYKLD